ncbi:MAG: hypothetical protein K0Q66_1220 [Chitinophagaceae bacterium]|nr:hypothetical protein [Chitinophagaceae bacterium]
MLVGVILISCQTKKAIVTNTNIAGTSYSGIVPDEGGSGIKQVVILDSGNTFRLSETYIGIEGKCVEKCGNWAVQDGRVMLYEKNAPIAQYGLAGNNLVYLQDAGAGTATPQFAGQGLLARRNFIRSKKIDPKFLEGIDVVAFGTEGSWSLDINHATAIQFSIPGMEAPIALSPIEPTLSGDTLTYNITSSNESMKIVLVPGYCGDNVSENLYDYKVSVTFRGKQYNGCGVIMNAAGSLSGTWLIRSFGDQEKKWKEQPYLVVDLANQKFYGHTGCNEISGTVRLRDNKVCFSDINSLTSNDCAGYNETAFVESLIKCNGFVITGTIMELTRNGQSVMIMQRQIDDEQ